MDNGTVLFFATVGVVLAYAIYRTWKYEKWRSQPRVVRPSSWRFRKDPEGNKRPTVQNSLRYEARMEVSEIEKLSLLHKRERFAMSESDPHPTVRAVVLERQYFELLQLAHKIEIRLEELCRL